MTKSQRHKAIVRRRIFVSVCTMILAAVILLIAFAVKAADRLHNLQSAFVASEDFRRRYILESIDWYMDFSPEIPKAVKALAESLSTPMYGLDLKYHPVEPQEHFHEGGTAVDKEE